MVVMRESLSRHFTLSKGGSCLKKCHIDTCDPFLSSALGHTLHHHCADKRNRNAPDTVDDFIRAGNIRTLQVGTLGISGLWHMLARVRHELLQTHRDIVGDPGMDGSSVFGRRRCSGIELLPQVNNQRFQASAATRAEQAQSDKQREKPSTSRQRGHLRLVK